jgi:cell division septum initiation protein DivIVA
MTILEDIEKLAAKVASDALADATAAEVRIDALKTLTPFYTILTKNAKRPSDDDEEPGFSDLRREIERAENGSAEVRDRSRRRTNA